MNASDNTQQLKTKLTPDAWARLIHQLNGPESDTLHFEADDIKFIKRVQLAAWVVETNGQPPTDHQDNHQNQPQGKPQIEPGWELATIWLGNVIERKNQPQSVFFVHFVELKETTGTDASEESTETKAYKRMERYSLAGREMQLSNVAAANDVALMPQRNLDYSSRIFFTGDPGDTYYTGYLIFKRDPHGQILPRALAAEYNEDEHVQA